MKNLATLCLLAGCLSAPAFAQQTNPDPSVKTGNGKTAPAKKSDKPAQAACGSMQGGTEASGGESVEAHAKTGKAQAANCGKENGKASAPHAAPTTPNPDVKR
ncbi:hypothetical protein GJ698_09255 [Pseudoduganella sp. FT26W]|uniref:Uncharacterized protein n=1 Tax=Duganella aquatilis TaxID=2666082 RepID=A0A844D6K1_9BURK|nr:hypothetical protein [Duganella aquatilis]MRW84272.1 hypothetical protein [Duganella aquatilis]